MTFFIPLEATTPLPNSPPFLVGPTDVIAQRQKTIKAIMKAKRIVVICGAGVSVGAGIPDFRSSEGLFHTLKRDNPREALSSGKDLFDASVFNSEQTTSLFCQMIAQLSELSKAAEPTAFHQLLRTLDNRGRLLRVYTQNIDAIEQKCGLSFGVPGFETKRGKGRLKSKIISTDDPVAQESLLSDAQSSSRLPSPAAETPRCIPLHGTLQEMHCQICTCSFPLEDYLTSLTSGQPPTCPECLEIERTRQLVGKRARGIGKLRPSVVLYNEAHRDGEGVGEVVRRDLIGSSKGKGRSGADLLLVVGTSLRVPGTKRMVREFAKAVRSRGSGSTSKDGQSSAGPASPDASPRRSPPQEEDQAMKAIYLNLDFPVPMREWEGVFDAWIQGDAQQFADILKIEVEKESKAKELAEERKRKREEEAILAAQRDTEEAIVTSKPAKRKAGASASSKSAKRRKVVLLPSPPNTPPDSTSQPSSSRPRGSSLKTGSEGPQKFVIKLPPRRFAGVCIPPSYRHPRPLPTPVKTPARSVRANTRTDSRRKRVDELADTLRVSCLRDQHPPESSSHTLSSESDEDLDDLLPTPGHTLSYGPPRPGG